MKQTLKDFLIFGLNRLEKGQRVDGLSGKYQANCTSDFDGAYFTTKGEAKRLWQAQKKNEMDELKKMCEEHAEIVAGYMNDEIRESLHGYYDTFYDFLKAYLKKDPKFSRLLWSEFKPLAEKWYDKIT